MRGRFITFEGVDGAGKTTQVEAVSELLRRERKLEVVTTREPGGTKLGERVREILLSHEGEPITPDIELLLLFTARAVHIERIRAELERGAWVLSDRFTDASYAYQGGGRGVAPERIEQLEEWVQGNFRPDLTIVLDLPVETSLDRLSKRAPAGAKKDRFERNSRDFFERVRAAYIKRCEHSSNRHRYALVKADRPVSEVTNEIMENLQKFD